jgi:hypothetical protein
MKEITQNLQKVREHRENLVLNYYMRLHEKKVNSQIQKRDAVEKMTFIKKHKNRQATKKLKKVTDIKNMSGGGSEGGDADPPINNNDNIGGTIYNDNRSDDKKSGYITHKNPDVITHLFDDEE